MDCPAWNLGHTGLISVRLMGISTESKMDITGQLIMLMDEGKENKTHQYTHDHSLLSSNPPVFVHPHLLRSVLLGYPKESSHPSPTVLTLALFLPLVPPVFSQGFNS